MQKRIVITFVLTMLILSALCAKPFVVKQLFDSEKNIVASSAVFMNDDNHYDFVTASGSDSSLSWHENKGDFTFIEHLIADTLEDITAMQTVDLEKDGDVDIIVCYNPTNMYNEYRLVLFRNSGDNTFTSKVICDSLESPDEFKLADLDNDTDLDLVINRRNNGIHCSFVLFENKDNIKFVKVSSQGATLPDSTRASTDYSQTLDIADIDGDGDKDILLRNNSYLQIYRNEGAFHFPRYKQFSPGGYNPPCAADLNSDGYMDILGSNTSFYKNSGDTTYPKTDFSIDSLPDETYQRVVGDFDGDGDSDIVFAEVGGSNLYLARHNSALSFKTTHICDYAGTISDVYTLDYDSDGDLDIITTNTGDDGIYLYLNDLAFELLTPLVNDTFYVGGDTCTIRWNGSNHIDNLKIQYSLNNGTDWESIVTVATNKGKYLWPIPDVQSDECLIRVLDASTNEELDRMDGTFTISHGSIRLIAPDKEGLSYYIGQEQYIWWETKGNSQDFKVEYTLHESEPQQGYPFLPIDESWDINFQGKHFLKWTPNFDREYDYCKVRVYSKTFPELCDTSAFYFRYVNLPTLKVRNPVGGETLSAGEGITISWDTEGYFPDSPGLYNIEFSQDSGATWSMIEDTLWADTLRWGVPSVFSDKCLIKVTWINYPEVYGISKAFSITTDTPVITKPNDSHTFISGTEKFIEWEKNGYPKAVDFQYSIDNKRSWITYSENTLSAIGERFVVPDVVADSCYFRIISTETKELFSETEKPIRFFPGAVFLTRGCLAVSGGGTHRFTWSTHGDESYLEYYRLELTYDSGQTWQIIGDSIPYGTTEYMWDFPNIAHDTTCGVRIISLVNEIIRDQSDPFFAIFTTPCIKVTSPKESEIHSVNSTLLIEWEWEYELDSVDISFAVDTGHNFSRIVAGIENSGSYEWQIPDTISSQKCFIRVNQTGKWYESGTSSQFTIEGGTGVLIGEGANVAGDAFVFSNNPVPSYQSEVTIFLPKNAKGPVHMVIRDILGAPVEKASCENAEESTFVWDLRNENGTPVGSGIYIVDLTWENRKGKPQYCRKQLGIQR